MKAFDSIYRQSQHYIDLREELIVLIALSNAPLMEVIKKAGISETRYYNMINNKRQIQPQHLTALLRAIIEIQNYRTTKIKIDGKRNGESQCNA